MCSGVKRLALFCLGAYGIALSGCDDDPPPPERQAPAPEHLPPSPAAPPADLEGTAGLAVDAPTEAEKDPAREVVLAEEAARFTTHAACVASVAAPGALVRDALEDLGLGSLRADACRVVEAVHAKSAEPCKGVILEPLRARCVVAAAVAREEPELCPPNDPLDPSRGRDVLCLALAGHRARACEALEASDAIACRAAVTQSRAVCKDAPTTARRRACQRAADRWRGLTRDEGARDAVEAHAVLLRHDGPRAFDELARVGAVLVERGGKRRLSLDAARGRTRLVLRVHVDGAGVATLDALELTEGGVVLAKATAPQTAVTVTLDEPDGGARTATVVVTPKGGGFERFEVTAPVRDLVRATP
jgi:hypothetical protein